MCGIYSVFDNCTRVANRIKKFYDRDIEFMKGDAPIANMRLRSGTATENRVWTNCDHLDLGDRAHYISNTRTESVPPKFSSANAKKWAIIKNTNIRMKILTRILATQITQNN